MTDREKIEQLENKLKEALSWWRATKKQLSQKCKETKANQKTIERLKAENAALRERLEKAVELPFYQKDGEYNLLLYRGEKDYVVGEEYFDDEYYDGKRGSEVVQARFAELKGGGE